MARNRLISDSRNTRPLSWTAAVSSSVAGIVVFPTALAGFQHLLFKPLRLSSSMPVPLVSSVIGAGAVLAGSAFASFSVASVASLLSSYTFNPKGMVLSTAGGAAVFKVLGGRFRSVLPSHLLRPGSFAVSSQPARGTAYARAYEKDAIAIMARKNGCHTCGRRTADFVSDHQPPSRLSVPGQRQRFYPQCRSCSVRQGGVLSQWSGGGRGSGSRRDIVTHGTSLRLYHLFLPTPLALPWVGGSSAGPKDGTVPRSANHTISEHQTIAAASSSDVPTASTCSSKQHAGTQTDFNHTETRDDGNWNGDDPGEGEYMLPIELIPQKLHSSIKWYLGLFQGDVGQIYAMVHVCLVLAALCNIL